MAGKLIREFLIQPELFDVISFEQFQGYFPERIRNHQDVKFIYKAFRKQRKEIDKVIDKSIEREYHKDHENTQSMTKHPQQDVNLLKHTVTEMEKKAMELEQELKRISQDNVELEGVIDDSLSNIESFHQHFLQDTHKTDQSMKDIQRIVDKL